MFRNSLPLIDREAALLVSGLLFYSHLYHPFLYRLQCVQTVLNVTLTDNGSQPVRLQVGLILLIVVSNQAQDVFSLSFININFMDLGL